MDISSLTSDKQVKLQYRLDVIRQCTLVETAKANGLAPMKYLKYILSDMSGSAFLDSEYLDDYLPWNPMVKGLCQ